MSPVNASNGFPYTPPNTPIPNLRTAADFAVTTSDTLFVKYNKDGGLLNAGEFRDLATELQMASADVDAFTSLYPQGIGPLRIANLITLSDSMDGSFGGTVSPDDFSKAISITIAANSMRSDPETLKAYNAAREEIAGKIAEYLDGDGDLPELPELPVEEFVDFATQHLDMPESDAIATLNLFQRVAPEMTTIEADGIANYLIFADLLDRNLDSTTESIAVSKENFEDVTNFLLALEAISASTED